MKKMIAVLAVILIVIACRPTGAQKKALKATASGHAVNLSWTASTSAAGCTSPCTFGYNVFRGTTPGGESNVPLNAAPVSAVTYTDSTVVLGSSPVTYYYVTQAVETVSGVTVSSASSNEASATFPGVPVAPTALTAVPQ